MRVRLAIIGGKPVSDSPWPQWPPYNPKAEERLKKALMSARWTVRGWWTGQKSLTQEFAERFADYLDVPYCVPTASGTSGLVISLEAANVGPGTTVILPALTWIATAIAVLQVNAVPILIDIDLETSCMSTEEIEPAVDSSTVAILPVHLHGSMANMDSILSLARSRNVVVIEDCAQSLGTLWRDRHCGTLGKFGCFSMNQEKVLTCGEGGAVVASDEDLFNKLVCLRTDGCGPVRDPPAIGSYEFVDVGSPIGTNYCPSEFQMAVLMDELDLLEERNKRREDNARFLDRELSRIPGVEPLRYLPQVSRRGYYRYVVSCNPANFAGRTAFEICRALRAELGCQVGQTDPPLHMSKLYQPLSKRRHLLNPEYTRRISTEELHFPHAERAYNTYVTFHHSVLLADQSRMTEIVEALEKVYRSAESIPK